MHTISKPAINAGSQNRNLETNGIILHIHLFNGDIKGSLIETMQYRYPLCPFIFRNLNPQTQFHRGIQNQCSTPFTRWVKSGLCPYGERIQGYYHQ
ncbi:MAG: hypothetical protein JXR71_04440 [Bacteroidales bacterium]|nr:hypothetical protein [Bacteroidales bacterium]